MNNFRLALIFILTVPCITKTIPNKDWFKSTNNTGEGVSAFIPQPRHTQPSTTYTYANELTSPTNRVVYQRTTATTYRRTRGRSGCEAAPTCIGIICFATCASGICCLCCK